MTIKLQAKHKSGFTVDSPLQPFIFPDGAAHIKGVDAPKEYLYQIADVRGLNHDDLFTLSMWADACDNRDELKILILPYLPGARMDRGVPAGAWIYANFIEQCVAPDQIITLDPHSTDAQHGYLFQRECTYTVFPVERIIRNEVQDPSTDSKTNNTYQGVIAPDKGAHDRAAAAAHIMGNLPVYTGGKTRDFDTGKITGFHMEDELPDEGRFLIVDDICDGGGTFLALAEATGLPPERLDLWVTHGIFSKGLDALEGVFGTVHTTDSFYRGESFDTLDPKTPFSLKVHKVTPYLYPEIQPYYYNQEY